MYFVQQQTTIQNHITIFGMIIMEFKMEKNEPRYATVKISCWWHFWSDEGFKAVKSVINIANMSPTICSYPVRVTDIHISVSKIRNQNRCDC